MISDRGSSGIGDRNLVGSGVSRMTSSGTVGLQGTGRRGELGHKSLRARLYVCQERPARAANRRSSRRAPLVYGTDQDRTQRSKLIDARRNEVVHYGPAFLFTTVCRTLGSIAGVKI